MTSTLEQITAGRQRDDGQVATRSCQSVPDAATAGPRHPEQLN
ncbi:MULTISPECIES: hypothetical protein [Microbacterium]|nr:MULTISPECIES: hypothetical protein [Microbacterium]MDQ1083442.1 hypothetical protein [Microbacterium sp. SORGH_AS_0344]MDQ1171278.1 hypothetical protein [Microbacterium proteolyticum]